MIVDAEQGDADLSPLADAVEKQLPPPYRVVARRGEGGNNWTVAARGIDVLELHFAGGDQIELASIDGTIDLGKSTESRGRAPFPSWNGPARRQTARTTSSRPNGSTATSGGPRLAPVKVGRSVP